MTNKGKANNWQTTVGKNWTADFSPEFQMKILEYLKSGGVPSKDAQGHSEHIQFKCRDSLLGVAEEIRERAPKGWFKTNSELYRTCIAVGMETILKFLKEGEVGTDWLKMMRATLNTQNRMSRVERLERLNQENAALEQKIMGLENMELKKEMMEKMTTIREQLKKAMSETGKK
jgi:hypothetical protein